MDLDPNYPDLDFCPDADQEESPIRIRTKELGYET